MRVNRLEDGAWSSKLEFNFGIRLWNSIFETQFGKSNSGTHTRFLNKSRVRGQLG
jgi:hypothetical protein